MKSFRFGALFLLSCWALVAQTITGTITGTVTDPSGAVIPNVTVTATNSATNITNTATTNESGVYNLLFLPVGNYNLSAESTGFKKSTAGPITLEVNQTARLDLQMQVGAATETVEVQALAPVLQTESASTGDTITSTVSSSIPLRGRNFAQLTLLVPGTITTNPQSFEGVGNNGSGGRPYVNGNREQSNNFLLDGADINESIDNLIGYSPNIDALQEVRVQTGNMGAEFGNANGAVVNMTLKSGTNQFHGNVFEFLQNDQLNANGFFNNRNRIARNSFKRNIFGGTLGGPIIRNKAFFFLDYQGAKQRNEGPASGSVAPATWRNGNLSTFPTSIIDPTTGVQFPGNIIPSNRIVNPVAKALFGNLALYPLPNQAGSGPLGISSNYISRSASKVDNDQADAKVDIRLSDKDSLMGRFSIRRARNTPLRVALPTSIGTLTEAPTTGGVINWTRTFSPTIVNEARMNFNRVRITDTPTDVAGLLGIDGNSKLGIPGGQPVSGLSELRLGEGLSNLGSIGAASDSITNTFQYGDNLTWQKGAHLLKLGGQAIRYQQNRFYGGNNGVLGYFQYNGFKTGSAFADFLLDQLQSKGRGSTGSLWGHRQWRDALFIQDDWKATSNLTLNLGLRWEYSQPVYEVADRQLNVDIYTGQIRNAGKNGNSRALYEPYYKQFMPRFGFAYSPGKFDRRFVVRGGYGITSYLEGTGANLRLPLNPPYFFESDIQYAVAAPGTIATGFNGLIARDQLSGQIRAWNPNLRPAFIQQWNFSTEYQFANSFSMTTAYVGQKGTHLVNPREGNQALPSANATDINQRRPLYGVLPLVTQISYTDSSATMNYNALQVTGRKRYSGGLEFIAAYTLSKTMTDNLGYYGAGGGPLATQSAYWQNAYDRKADYGPAFFDARHNFNIGGVYDLPYGRKRTYGSSAPVVADLVLGGWQVGYNFNYHTGFPITMNAPGRNNSGNRANRANRYLPLTIVNQSIDNWFGTDPSAKPCAPDVNNGVCAYGQQFLGSFGTAGVGTERAPNYYQFDATVGKNFNITERQYIQFRTEFFNALNQVTFGAPNRDTSSASFGQITSQSNTPRVIQFALKYFF